MQGKLNRYPQRLFGVKAAIGRFAVDRLRNHRVGHLCGGGFRLHHQDRAALPHKGGIRAFTQQQAGTGGKIRGRIAKGSGDLRIKADVDSDLIAHHGGCTGPLDHFIGGNRGGRGRRAAFGFAAFGRRGGRGGRCRRRRLRGRCGCRGSNDVSLKRGGTAGIVDKIARKVVGSADDNGEVGGQGGTERHIPIRVGGFGFLPCIVKQQVDVASSHRPVVGISELGGYAVAAKPYGH